MSLTIKNQNKRVTLVPEGKHAARCYAIIDLGIQENKVYGTKSPRVLIGWEFSELLAPTGKPLTFMQHYTANLNPKSALTGLLESWRGKTFSWEDQYGFQLESMLGEACHLVIKHRLNNEKGYTWAVIDKILPFPIGVPYPTLHHLPIVFDLDYYTQDDYLSIPASIRKKINLSMDDLT